MDKRQPFLRATLDGLVVRTAEDWCEAVGAKGAKFVLYPPDETCPRGQPVQFARGPYIACGVRGLCPLQAEGRGRTIGQAGDSSARVSLCLTCRLSAGETLALQADLPEDAAPIVLRSARPARLAAPLLLWAREALERQALEERLKESEARYRAELRTAIKSHEDEREWLALEVHDRLAQELATVFQQLQTVESLARSLPEISQVAIRGSILCREVMREARSIMNDLRPPVQDELGLIPLLQEELRHLERETGCRVQQRLSYRAPPARDVRVVLYRIFHEALINVRRHANATELMVSLVGDDDAVRLEVQDNGLGFDVSKLLALRHVGGLMSMQRRAELAGGICLIESKPRQGTIVRARIPLAGRAFVGGGQWKIR